MIDKSIKTIYSDRDIEKLKNKYKVIILPNYFFSDYSEPMKGIELQSLSELIEKLSLKNPTLKNRL